LKQSFERLHFEVWAQKNIIVEFNVVPYTKLLVLTQKINVDS